MNMAASIAYGVVIEESYHLSDVDLTPHPEDTKSDITFLSFGDPECPQHAVVLTSTLRRTSLVMTAGTRAVTDAERSSLRAFCARHGLKAHMKHNLGEPTWLVFVHGVIC